MAGDCSKIVIIQFQHGGKTYDIQYCDKYNCVHMYSLLEMVYGEKVAAKWLFERSCYEDPVSDLSRIDRTLDDIFSTMFCNPYFQVAWPTNPYDQFKKDHGSLQDAIVAKVANQKKNDRVCQCCLTYWI